MHGRQPPSSPFSGAVLPPARRHKPAAIFTYHAKDAPQNVYYEMNPYLLTPVHPAPTHPHPRRPSRSRHSTQSKEVSDRNSHRSLKLVRVNGLREAEKPRILKHNEVFRQSDQQSLHSSRGEHSRRTEREAQLENENRALKAEREALRERARAFEKSKEMEIHTLEERIMQLIDTVVKLEEKVERGEEEWRTRASKLSNTHDPY